AIVDALYLLSPAIISYLLISFILFIFFKGYSFSYILSTWFKTCLISILLLNFIVKRISKKLDGITGDILGMIAEISESLFLYIFFIVYNIF
ncbi:MAG: adenosylcobinamide-GDP ribazoletransferase, partial [Peptostreptococcaceae bacterium]|nr:adenosylcobinamide-GDP ribazoletransferase [Peptostreptococcaceae bacterium]